MYHLIESNENNRKFSTKSLGWIKWDYEHLYELNGYKPVSQVLLRIIALRLHVNRIFRFKGYLQNTTVTTYKRCYIFGRHTKHNLIMSNCSECSLEGPYYELIPFRKVILLKQLLENCSINSSHFTKIGGSLYRSQQPNLGYSESDEANDLHTIDS